MVFNIFLLFLVPIMISTTYNNSKKCNTIAIIIYFVLGWLPRWISSVAYLNGDSEYRQTMDNLYSELNSNTCELSVLCEGTMGI